MGGDLTSAPMVNVLNRLEGVRRSGEGFVARCPAHDDRDPSLGIDEGDDGRVLLCCRAGCDLGDVLSTLSLGPGDLFIKASNGNGKREEPNAVYRYVDEAGALLFEVLRFPNKRFVQRRPDGHGGWIWKLGDVRRVLYHLDDVADAVREGVPVFVVEGEKDADALSRAGCVATTAPHGAGKWRTEYAEMLRGADVIIVPDQDAPGTKHAADVEASLVGVARSVKVVRPAVGKDASDHLAAGKTVEEFVHADARAGDPTPADAGDSTEQPDDSHDLLRLAIHGAARRAGTDGASFILDTPAQVVPIWGRGEEVLWAQGEPTLANGPTGVGKTSVAQQLVKARLGLCDQVLGYPVAYDGRPVLYVAADRPSQAARSMARMVTEADRDVLARGLKVWKGPLPYDVVKKPEMLAVLAAGMGVGTIVIDSLKDVASKLSEDEGGSAVNQAMQALVAEGVEVLVLHHQRKAQAGGGKPKALADVYGSTWITAGMGSVVVLWGEAGDAIVELSHLKQPVDAVGPLMLVHDHRRGHTTVQAGVDLAVLLEAARNGITAAEVAKALFNASTPSPNEVQRARRKLDALVRAGMARRTEPERGGAGGSKPSLFHSTASLDVGS